MKKYLLMITLLLVCTCSMEAFAMSGSIQITVPQEAQGSVVSYAKIAKREELDESRVSEWMEMDIHPEGSVRINEEGKASIEDLPEGIYQIQIVGENGYDFARSLVSIPMWDEEQKSMSYEISIFPKHTYTPPVKEREVIVPNTGDDNQNNIYIAIGIISLVITVLCVLECQNKYSTKGGPKRWE